jgi:hypothetical protein
MLNNLQQSQLDQLLQQSQQAQQRAQQAQQQTHQLLQQSQLLLHQSQLQLQALNPSIQSIEQQSQQLQQALQQALHSLSQSIHQLPQQPQPQPQPEPIDLFNDEFAEIDIETEIEIDPEQKGWDFISMDEISVKEYLEEDKNHIAVQIEKNANSIVLLDKTNIQNGFDDALRYECKEATGRVGYEFNNVYRDPPLFINLKQFGIFVGYGYASQIPIILADNTHQYYILKKWETKLVSVASKNYIDDYPNISSVSASHCQAGQDGDVYMWYKTNTNPTNDITNTTNDITNITNDIANTTNDITNTNTTNGGKKRKNRSIKTKRSKGGRKTKKVNK